MCVNIVNLCTCYAVISRLLSSLSPMVWCVIAVCIVNSIRQVQHRGVPIRDLIWIKNLECSTMSYGTVTADLFRCIEQAQQGQVKVSSASRPNRLELENSLPTGKQLHKAT
jgi:hypothetical protein